MRSHLLRHVGLEAGDEEILIASGARQALFLITQCLLKPGDSIGIEAPSYFYSLPVFQAAGLRLYAIATDEDGITPEGLEALAARRALRMIFLNPVFQNPTGHVMSPGRKRRILDLCAMKHIPVVKDDAYSALAFSRAPDIAPLKRHDTRHQVLYIGSLSSYVGKNIRAGWLVAPCSIARQLAGVREQIDAGLSVLPQLLAKEYLTGTAAGHQEFLRRVLAARARLPGAVAGAALPRRVPLPAASGRFLCVSALPRRIGAGICGTAARPFASAGACGAGP